MNRRLPGARTTRRRVEAALPLWSLLITDGSLATIARRAAGRRTIQAHGVALLVEHERLADAWRQANSGSVGTSPTVCSPPSPAGRQDDVPSKRMAWPSASASGGPSEGARGRERGEVTDGPYPDRSQCLPRQATAVSRAHRKRSGPWSQGSPVLTVGPQRDLSMTVDWPEQGSSLNAGNHSAPSGQDPSFSFAPA